MPVATEDLTIEVIRLAKVLQYTLELIRKNEAKPGMPNYVILSDLLDRTAETIRFLETNSR